MTFQLLVDRQEFVRQIADLKYREFAYMVPGKTVEDFELGVRTHLNREGLPLTYVKVNDMGEMLGSFSLRPHDLESHKQWSPWLASVVVPEAHRNRGVGESLVKTAETKAKEIGISKLYLFTPNKEKWYEKLGWKTVEQTVFNQVPVVIMSKDLWC